MEHNRAGLLGFLRFFSLVWSFRFLSQFIYDAQWLIRVAQRQFPPGDEQIEMQRGAEQADAQRHLSPSALVIVHDAARKMIAQTDKETASAAAVPLPPRPQPNQTVQPMTPRRAHWQFDSLLAGRHG